MAYARRRLIVNRKFQFAFIRNNLLLLLFTFALIFGAIKIWERYEVERGFLLQPPQNSEVVAWAKANNVPVGSAEFLRQFIARAKVYTFFSLLWKPLAIVLVINILVLVIANIYYSHTIAGPIYRLIDVLDRKSRGEKVEPVKFRRNDAFQELAEAINDVLLKDKV